MPGWRDSSVDLATIAIAATPAFLASAVEFVEATTIVLAVGITRGWRAPLVGSALSALTLALIVGTLGIVIAIAAVLRSPLTAVPENLLKFGVGAMLSTFGVFWFGEGVGAEWPGDAASIPLILGSFLLASWLAVRLLNGLLPEGARVEARNV